MNGFLMHKNCIISRIVDNTVIDDNNLLPLRLKKGDKIDGWLESRAIDRHRTNSRLLKKVLRLSDTSDVATVLVAHAATITDNYWVMEQHENLEYEDVLFSDDIFADVALFGRFSDVSNAEKIGITSQKSPELTNTGSFEKCWKITDGVWYMYKRGTIEELFSEIFVFRLGESLGFDMAEYRINDNCVVTKDFTNNKEYDYEPAAALVGDNEDYLFNYNVFDGISREIAQEYVNIIFLDTLCYNMDRHTYNYGVLRDSKTGIINKMAPNFDNNIALISRGYTSTQVSESDILISLWKDFLDKSGVAFRIPELTEEKVRRIADSIDVNVDKEYVTEFVMNRYEKMK